MATELPLEMKWTEYTEKLEYFVELPGNWDNMQQRIWKTSKGEYFQITKKNEAIFVKEDESYSRKKIKVKENLEVIPSTSISINGGGGGGNSEDKFRLSFDLK